MIVRKRWKVQPVKENKQKTDSPSHYFNVKKESPTKLKSSSDVLPEPGTEDDKSVEPDVPNTLASSVPSVEQNWLLHSPFFASVLAGSMLMNGPLLHGRELKGSYLNLPKIEPSVSSSSFNPLLGLTPTFLSAEQMLKTLSEKQKPWFSVLPRIPCDSTSIIQGSPCKHIPSKSSQETHSTLSNSSQPPTTSHSQSTPTSSMAGHTSTAAALALANLHLGLLNGLPPPLMPNPLLNPSLMNSLYTTTESSRLTPTPYSLSASVIPPSFCSTPSSVPSPSSTPGPVPYGSYSNCSLENSLQAQQSLLSEKLNQYATPRAIPKEYQKGWWTINDVEQLKSFLNSLHPRGVRERHLQKQLQKHFNYVCHAFTQGQQKAADLEISDTDRESCTKSGGAPDSDKEDQWSPEVSLRVDLAILEHVEDMEEKVARASMQMKQGWKVPSKLSSDPTIKFKPACLMLKKENCSVFYCEKGINYQKKNNIFLLILEKTHLKQWRKEVLLRRRQ
ncbi:bromodomain adjacent to zinc finger domain protein 2B-like isoform X1 [Tachypleus tridentatus]|uniref:bromodomain adjacent to zinc finger domain protein 2B-like isoform X1 n=1 Tax=Tachypleus tridentatus TaxID=6853 RepID=UPI003FD1A82B